MDVVNQDGLKREIEIFYELSSVTLTSKHVLPTAPSPTTTPSPTTVSSSGTPKMNAALILAVILTGMFFKP